MRKTFEIFTENRWRDLCELVNGLNSRKKKFTITPWSSTNGKERGFVVWYYV